MNRLITIFALLVAAFLLLIQRDVDGQLLVNGWHGMAAALFVILALMLREIITMMREEG